MSNNKPKGMNLDQLRTELDTEAQKRCRAQEKTIKLMETEIKIMVEDAVCLFDRCFSHTSGKLCDICKITKCPRRKTIVKEGIHYE